MVFKEIDPKLWTYEKDGDFLEGYLLRIQEHIGRNDSAMYDFETKDGLRSVWGSAILDSKLGLIKVGTKVRITYKGLGEAIGGKSAAKIFKVEVDVEETKKSA